MWKDVKGYEGIYKVSEDATIYSEYSKRVLKTNKASSGYETVSLCKDGKCLTKTVHRIVAEAYLPHESSQYLVVNHINGNKLDNRLENLEWITHKENTHHAIELGIMKVHGEDHPFYGKKHREESKEKMRQSKLGKCGVEHPRSTPIAKCDLHTRDIIEVFESQRIAAKKCGLSQGNINMVLRGRRSQTGGFYWKYVQVGDNSQPSTTIENTQ